MQAVFVCASLFSQQPAAVAPKSSPQVLPPNLLPPNVLLVTVDTLRPDALGWISGGHPTPAFDALARSGVRTARALSPAPLTLPAHTSLLTGLLPRRHGVRDNGQTVPGGLDSLAAALSDAGYGTAAFVSGFPLDSAFGLAQGFAHYDDDFPPGSSERSAKATAEAAITWLEGAPEPWFAWVHFYDPHDPYEPPAELRRDGPRGAYDGEVLSVDRELGKLLATAGGAGTLVVLTADHGESLGEHGEETHGFFIYQSTMEVPLVFAWPSKLPPRLLPGTLRPRLIDVFPTLLELLDLPLPKGLDGMSLAAALRGRDFNPPPAYLETRRPWISYGWAPLRAVVEGDWKLIAAPKPELYNLAADPTEADNLVDRERRRARSLQKHLRTVESQPARQAGGTDDPEAVARLRALGYAGGGAASPDEPPPDAPDPKDRIGLWNLLGEAEGAMAAGDARGALAAFDRALAQDPQNRFALARSAEALLALGQAAEARERAAKAVALDPDQPESRRTLAVSLMRSGAMSDAVTQWLEVVRLQPERADGWLALGSTLGVAGQRQRAVGALSRAAELAPDEAEPHLRLGFALFGVGEKAAAAAALSRAAELSAEAFAHAASLGLLLHDLERSAEAEVWLTRATPDEADFVPARLELARILLDRGEPAAARNRLQEAIARDPRARAVALGDSALAPLLEP
ncbi:MAG: sulfatase-like hydrolase/transferase [Acidobacteriota bacterium]